MQLFQQIPMEELFYQSWKDELFQQGQRRRSCFSRVRGRSCSSRSRVGSYSNWAGDWSCSDRAGGRSCSSRVRGTMTRMMEDRPRRRGSSSMTEGGSCLRTGRIVLKDGEDRPRRRGGSSSWFAVDRRQLGVNRVVSSGDERDGCIRIWVCKLVMG